MTSLAPHMEAFLREHLVRHRGASQHTCDSYAYSFQSLFEFAAKKLKVAPSALMLEQLNAALISTFLEHLETTRGNSAETRNIRLAAIRSFFRFLQHREPGAVEQVRRVLAIPFKKTDTRLVPYLVQEEIQALLDAPDPSTWEGVRDRAMLHLAVCAGLRVSELTGLCLDDVAPQSASIRVRGKGRRERALPLWKTTAAALRAWLAIRGSVASPELFVNARGQPFSRWGVAYVLHRHTKTADRKCLTLHGKQVSPHVLRHYVPFRTMSCDGVPLRISTRNFRARRGKPPDIARHSLMPRYRLFRKARRQSLSQAQGTSLLAQ
jgi:integrase/recombinase XerD